MGLETELILKAASSKWNFLPFRPGLVGGHCIGVDPYYLTYRAQACDFYPEMILAGRRINDSMGVNVASQMIKAMINKGISINNAKILVMGLTFKENCPDIRNTKVIDVIEELSKYKCDVDVYDPLVEKGAAKNEYGIELIDKPELNAYDGIILAVSHDDFKNLGIEEIRNFGRKEHILYDLKCIFSVSQTDLRL